MPKSMKRSASATNPTLSSTSSKSKGKAHLKQKKRRISIEKQNMSEKPFVWMQTHRDRVKIVQLSANVTKRISDKSDMNIISPTFQFQDCLPREVAFTTLKSDCSVMDLNNKNVDEEDLYNVFRYELFHTEFHSDFESSFIENLKSKGIDLNKTLNIDDSKWQELIQALKDSDYIRTSLEDGWFPQNDIRVADRCSRKLYTQFDCALTLGMCKGRAKSLWSAVVNYILEEKLDYDPAKFYVYHPSNFDPVIIPVQLVSDSKFFYDHDIKSSDTSKSEKKLEFQFTPEIFTKPSQEIPDLLVVSGIFPGLICLSMEFKQDPKNKIKAFHQCTKQLLSQLALQKCAFGLIISAGKYSVICITKSENQQNENERINGEVNIYSFETYIQRPPTPISGDKYYHLIPENLTKLANWIYWIMEYNKRQITDE